MEPLACTGKNRTAFRARAVANGDDMGETPSTAQHGLYAFGLVAGEVDADLLHGRHHERIELAGFQPGALRLKKIWAGAIEKRLGHLAAGAIVNADE